MLRMRASSREIAELKGKEQGKRAFILANGPSILKEDLSLLKNEIVVGMNASTMLEKRYGFTTAYYTLSDRRFLNHPDKRRWGTSELSEATIRVVRSDLRSDDERAFHERTFYVRPISKHGFSQDLSAGYFFGCTTTLLALQLAFYLGIQEVFILGCDLRYASEAPRFYPESIIQLEDSFTSTQIINITNAAMTFEKVGRRVVSCSPESFLRPWLPYQPFIEACSKKPLIK